MWRMVDLMEHRQPKLLQNDRGWYGTIYDRPEEVKLLCCLEASPKACAKANRHPVIQRGSKVRYFY